MFGGVLVCTHLYGIDGAWGVGGPVSVGEGGVGEAERGRDCGGGEVVLMWMGKMRWTSLLLKTTKKGKTNSRDEEMPSTYPSQTYERIFKVKDKVRRDLLAFTLTDEQATLTVPS